LLTVKTVPAFKCVSLKIIIKKYF